MLTGLGRNQHGEARDISKRCSHAVAQPGGVSLTSKLRMKDEKQAAIGDSGGRVPS